MLLILSLLVGESSLTGEQVGDESAEGTSKDDMGDDGEEVDVCVGEGVDERSDSGDGDGDGEDDNGSSTQVSCNFLLPNPPFCLRIPSSPNM